MQSFDKSEILCHLLLHHTLKLKINDREMILRLAPDWQSIALYVPIYTSKSKLSQDMRDQVKVPFYTNWEMLSTELIIDEKSNQILVKHTIDLDDLEIIDLKEVVKELFWVARERKLILSRGQESEILFSYIRKV